MYAAIVAGFILDLILDHIPIWGWVIIVAAPIGAALYFFGPILLPIWRMLPEWLKALILGVGAAFIAYMGGRYKGRYDADQADKKRDAEALQKRNEVDNAVDKKTAPQVQDDLRNRWSRDSDS
jgi:MFS family permease